MNRENFGGLWGDAALYGYMFRRLGSAEFEEWDCIDVEGRLWRNPEELREGQSPYTHGTSRDMMLGALLGASSKDLYGLQQYLGKHNGRLSPDGDNRTVVTASGFWQLTRRTGTLKGLTLKQRLLVLLGGLVPRFTLMVELLTAWKGYQMHLCLVTFWLYLDLGVVKRGSWFFKRFLQVAEERSSNNHLVAFLWNTEADRRFLREEAVHARNRALAPTNHWQDGWDAAEFEQWKAHRVSSVLYSNFVEALSKKVEK